MKEYLKLFFAQEPVKAKASIGGLIAAVCVVLVQFGVPVSEAMKDALQNLAVIIVGGFTVASIRASVSPATKVETALSLPQDATVTELEREHERRLKSGI